MTARTPFCSALVVVLLVAPCCVEYDADNPFDPNTNGGRDPFALHAVADTGMVRLAWNPMNVSGVRKYLLYRSAVDSASFELFSEVADAARDTFADRAVDADTMYYYRLTMVADGEESNPSLVVSAQPIAPPVAALGVLHDTLSFGDNLSTRVQVLSNTGAGTLSWQVTVPTEPWLSMQGPTSGTLAADSSVSLTFVVDRDTLLPGTYEVPVTFQSTEGGNVTFYVQVIQPDLDPPNASVLRLDAASADSVRLAWSVNTDADFLLYRLTRSADSVVNSGDPTWYTTHMQAETLYVDTAVVSRARYHYRLYTMDADSLLDSSNVVSVTTPAARELRGVVRNSLTAAAVAGATVRFEGAADSVLSGTDGSYVIVDPDTGLHIATVAHGGHITAVDTVRIAWRGTAMWDAALVPLPSVTRIAATATFYDLNDVVADDALAYVVERDYLRVAVSTVNLATGAAGINSPAIGSGDVDAAEICVLNGAVYVSEPSASTVHRLSDPLALSSPQSQQDLGFEVYGLVVSATGSLFAVGAGSGTDGIVAVVDTGLTAAPTTYTITDLSAQHNSINTLGPRIAVAGAVAYVSNGSNTGGKVGRVDLQSGTNGVAVCRWPSPSDVVAYGGYVYVASSDGAADSLMAYDTSLTPVHGIYTGAPGVNLVAPENGPYAGLLVMCAKNAPRVLFLSPLLRRPVGEVALGGNAMAVCFTPDGSKAVVTTATEVYRLAP